MTVAPENIGELRLYEMTLPADDLLPTSGHAPTFGDKAYDYWVQGVQDFIDIFPFRRRRVAEFIINFHDLGVGTHELGAFVSKVYDAGPLRKLRLEEVKLGVGETVIDSLTTVALVRPEAPGEPERLLAGRREFHRVGNVCTREVEAIFPFTPGFHPLETRWIDRAIDAARAIQRNTDEAH